MNKSISTLLANILILCGALFSSCDKEELSKVEILLGKWELIELDRHVIRNERSRYAQTTEEHQLNYQNNQLINTFDKTGKTRDNWDLPWEDINIHSQYQYKATCYLEFLKDGTCTFFEQIIEPDGNVLVSQKWSNAWRRHEQGLEYTYFVETRNPVLGITTKIFMFDGYFSFHENDISKNQIIIKADGNEGNFFGHIAKQFIFRKM